jgi:hypothetical protein
VTLTFGNAPMADVALAGGGPDLTPQELAPVVAGAADTPVSGQREAHARLSGRQDIQENPTVPPGSSNRSTPLPSTSCFSTIA